MKQATRTGRKAIVTNNGRAGWFVVFGRYDTDGTFVPAHAKPGRDYTTEAGARRAALNWEAKS